MQLILAGYGESIPWSTPSLHLQANITPWMRPNPAGYGGSTPWTTPTLHLRANSAQSFFEWPARVA